MNVQNIFFLPMGAHTCRLGVNVDSYLLMDGIINCYFIALVQKIDLEILMDLHIIRVTESKSQFWHVVCVCVCLSVGHDNSKNN